MTIGVLLGADSLLTKRSGIGRVTLEVARALRHEPEVAGLRLWISGKVFGADALDRLEAGLAAAPSAVPAKPKPVRLLIGRVPGVQTLRAQLRRHEMRRDLAAVKAAGGGRLVYHETNMIPNRFRGTTVVQMNDLSWHHHPELHPADRIAWIQRNLARMLRQTTRYVAISEFTAASLAADFGVPRARIDVVPCAGSAVFRPLGADDPEAIEVLARHGLADRRYVLSISTLEPRKNFDRLVAAHLALPPALRARFPLVIAGGSGWGTALANAAAEQAKRAGTLRLLGFVADPDLAVLTARASVFAYVSLYEGFGLPLLEAMMAGTPVVASATTATGETAGDAALLIDPLDVADIARALRRVLEDDGLAADLRARGLVRAASFTWQATAQGLIRSWHAALR